MPPSHVGRPNCEWSIRKEALFFSVDLTQSENSQKRRCCESALDNGELRQSVHEENTGLQKTKRYVIQ